ncbi:MAG: ABC transporter permease [Pseudomonadota bacterium]
MSVAEQPAPGGDLLADAGAPALQAAVSQSYLSLVWRRLRRNTLGMVGLFFVIFLILVAILADVVSPYDPSARNRDSIYSPPQALHFVDENGWSLFPFTHPQVIEFDMETLENKVVTDTSQRCVTTFLGKGWEYELLGIKMDRHLFAPSQGCAYHVLGTDRDGRDVFSRMVRGSRLTLMMAGLVVVVSITIGSLVGIVSGYFGGKVDYWIQRFTEVVLALPELPFYFALVSIIPATAEPLHIFFMLAAILSLLKWAQLSREVRGKTLAISQLDYVVSAEAVGAGASRIVVRHILPNVMSHVVVITTLMVPQVVLIESFLSFIGLGVQPPLISWGSLLNAGRDLQNLGSYPWVLSPVVAILITVLGFNMFGDGLRDAIDPYAD